jgi:hypothetical protein
MKIKDGVYYPETRTDWDNEPALAGARAKSLIAKRMPSGALRFTCTTDNTPPSAWIEIECLERNMPQAMLAGLQVEGEDE